MKKDYYNILGVDKKASADEIKKAYRKLAMENHPDRHQGDKAKEEKFKDVAEAYETLSDPTAKQKYDNPRSAVNDCNFDPFMHFREETYEPDVSTIVNLSQKVGVKLEDFFAEKEIDVYFNRSIIEPNSKGVCTNCGGSGQRAMRFGHMGTITMPCEACGSSGYTFKKTHKPETMKVKLKLGQFNYVFNGKGHMIDEHNSGAAYFHVLLTPSNGFYLDENQTLCYKVVVNLEEYLCGSDLIIPHFTGKLRIHHQNNGEASRFYRIKEKGLQVENKKFDLLVEVIPKLPVTLNEREKNLVKQLAAQDNFSVLSQTP